jgi:hypothetical protein
MIRLYFARFFAAFAWLCIPRDWVFYKDSSLERSVYDALQRAEVDLDRLYRAGDLKRVEDCRTRGTDR